MDRNINQMTKRYDLSKLKEAVDQIQTYNISIREAERTYGIPRTTLSRHLQNRFEPDSNFRTYSDARTIMPKPLKEDNVTNTSVDRKVVLVNPYFPKDTIKGKTLSKLDQDICTILNSDLSDESKVNEYISIVRRYKASDAISVQPMITLKNLQEQVLQTIPLNNRHKAMRLLQLIEKTI